MVTTVGALMVLHLNTSASRVRGVGWGVGGVAGMGGEGEQCVGWGARWISYALHGP